jgi:hypothetical protein
MHFPAQPKPRLVLRETMQSRAQRPSLPTEWGVGCRGPKEGACGGPRCPAEGLPLQRLLVKRLLDRYGAFTTGELVFAGIAQQLSAWAAERLTAGLKL